MFSSVYVCALSQFLFRNPTTPKAALNRKWCFADVVNFHLTSAMQRAVAPQGGGMRGVNQSKTSWSRLFLRKMQLSANECPMRAAILFKQIPLKVLCHKTLARETIPAHPSQSSFTSVGLSDSKQDSCNQGSSIVYSG